jgi:HEAT repeats
MGNLVAIAAFVSALGVAIYGFNVATGLKQQQQAIERKREEMAPTAPPSPDPVPPPNPTASVESSLAESVAMDSEPVAPEPVEAVATTDAVAIDSNLVDAAPVDSVPVDSAPVDAASVDAAPMDFASAEAPAELTFAEPEPIAPVLTQPGPVVEPAKIGQRMPALVHLKSAIATAEPAARCAIAQTLGQAGAKRPGSASDGIVAALGTLLQDPNAQVQAAAVAALGKIPSRQILPWLEQAQRSPHSLVKHSAAQAFQQLKLPKAALPMPVVPAKQSPALARKRGQFHCS